MKKTIGTALIISMMATSAFAKSEHYQPQRENNHLYKQHRESKSNNNDVKNLLIGGILGAVITDYYKTSREYDINSCYSVRNSYSQQYRSEQEAYERGRILALCEERELRIQRAYECGYSGACPVSP